MKPLTQRQEYILGLIVREYVKVPTPVSSKGLVELFDLNLSSATVRNEMVALEEEGLIASPHTSAGRVPTEAGYRYFVQKLLGDAELDAPEQRMIQHQFHQAQLDMEQWLRLAVSVLAQTVRSAALVTQPVINQARFKHMEMINTQGRLVLLVLVLDGGDVRQQMLTLSEPVPQERLSQVADQINQTCIGRGAAFIRAEARLRPALDQEVMELAADLLERANKQYHVVYYDGLLNILDPVSSLDQLEGASTAERDGLIRALANVDGTGARQALHLLEEQSLLEDILAEALTPETEGVQVMIAGNGRWDELSHTSIVIARYGVKDQFAGAVGVLGPTRLHYGRAISAVRYVAGLMSDMLIDVYGQGDINRGEAGRGAE